MAQLAENPGSKGNLLQRSSSVPCISISEKSIRKVHPFNYWKWPHKATLTSRRPALLAVTNGDSRTADRLRFAFNMYDLDGDGKVSVKDMIGFVTAVTDLLR